MEKVAHKESVNLAKRLQGKFINGIEATELGTEAILFMRKFMLSQSMPEELVTKITKFEATN